VNTGHSLAACKGGICDYRPRSDDVREKTADLESRARDCREFEISPPTSSLATSLTETFDD